MAEEEGHHHHSLPKNEEQRKPLEELEESEEELEECNKRATITNPRPKNAEQKKLYNRIKDERFSQVLDLDIVPQAYIPPSCGAPERSEGLPITQSVVRPSAPQTTPWALQTTPNVKQKGDETVEEPVLCKGCNKIFREKDMLKIECKCINALTLVHDVCVGDNCNKCGQKIQKKRVTLLQVSVPIDAVSKKKSSYFCFW